MQTEIVTDIGRFAVLRDAWCDLWGRSDGAIFQHHEWLTGWWNGVLDRPDIRVCIAVASDGGRLVAAFPFAIYRRTGVRVLGWAAFLFSDYCDCLVDPDATGTLPALWQDFRRSVGFDIIQLRQVRPDAKCVGFLDDLGSVRLADRQERCMRIDNLWQDGEAFFRSLNKKGRNNHTRGKRILEEAGGEVRFHVVAPPDDPAPLINQLIRLKLDWLRKVEPTSPLLGPDEAVLRAVLAGAWKTGMVRVFVLSCGDRMAAASVNFVYSNRMQAYFTAYDPALDRASPGTILIVDYAKWAFDRGLLHVDFLRGDEGFKDRMANAELITQDYEGSATAFGYLASSGHKWLSRWRQRQAANSDDQPSESAQLGQ